LYASRNAGSLRGSFGICVSACASSVRAVSLSALGSAARIASRPGARPMTASTSAVTPIQLLSSAHSLMTFA